MLLDWLKGYSLGTPAVVHTRPTALVIAALFDAALRSGEDGWGAHRPLAQGFLAGVEASYNAEVGGRVNRATATAEQNGALA